jgi:hypothetical protein
MKHEDGMYKILIKTRNVRFQLGVHDFSLWTKLKLEVDNLKELQQMNIRTNTDVDLLTEEDSSTIIPREISVVEKNTVSLVD